MNGSIEDLIRGAQSGGWEWFKKFDEQMNARISGDRKPPDPGPDQAEAIRAAWKAFAQSEGGKLALQDLCDRTLNRATFLTHLGLPADQLAIYGAAREGQNAIVLAILRIISEDEAEHKKPTRKEN